MTAVSFMVALALCFVGFVFWVRLDDEQHGRRSGRSSSPPPSPAVSADDEDYEVTIHRLDELEAQAVDRLRRLRNSGW